MSNNNIEINKERINYHNKDARIKIGLHNHGNMLLRYLKIPEEIKSIEDTELTTLEGKNMKLDFRAKLKSGKRLNVEGESNVVREPALEKTLGYSREVNCHTHDEVISVIIALAEGNNQKTFDKEYCFTFKPFLVEIKKFDGEKYLIRCKNKIENNEEFTEDDCGIIDLIPEMKFDRKLSEVVEELCYVIKDGRINQKYKRELTTIINLSIDYYITDKKKRNELTEMLKMDKVIESEYNRVLRITEEEGIEEGRKEGIEEGRKEGIEEGDLKRIDNILDEISKNPEMTMEELTNNLIYEREILKRK